MLPESQQFYREERRIRTQCLIAIPRGAIIGLVVLIFSGCVNFQRLLESLEPHKHPNVILIVLDTLRADHTSCYGYPLRTTPELERFSEQAVLFRRAMTPAPWTLPGHASLFTGLYPFEHGARTYIAKQERLLPQIQQKNLARPLHRDFETIAEHLQDQGYQTAAIIANNIYLQRYFGLAQGFEYYDVNYQYGDGINARVMTWLDNYLGGPNADRPFFLFINYMDNHRPYNTTPAPEVIPYEVAADSNATLNLLYRLVMREPSELPHELIKVVNDQYDLGVVNVDKFLGVLFEYLKRKLIFDECLLIVTSDHGEYLGEHYLVEHSKDVYQEALWIPLLLKAPYQSKRIVENRLISLVHLPAIMLSFADLPVPDCFPYRWPETTILAENHFARLKDVNARWGYRFRRERFAIFWKFWKYIHSSDDQHELYRLDRDPEESRNLVETRAPIAQKLDDWLQPALTAISEQEAEEEYEQRELTKEEEERMRSLGYL